MTTLSYSPFSVFLELFVEIGYQFAFILTIDLLYKNVGSIGGWNRSEMMFFVGLNMFMAEITLSLFFIGSLFKLPELVRTGGLDTLITKPVDSMFLATFCNPYVSGLISTMPGIYIMLSQYLFGNLSITMGGFLMGVVTLIIGVVIVYSFSIIFTSIVFKFPDSRRAPRLSNDFIFSFTSYPLGVYNNLLERFLVYVVPLLFLTAIPSQMFLRGIDWFLFGWGILFSCLFFSLARLVWKKALFNYSSASS